METLDKDEITQLRKKLIGVKWEHFRNGRAIICDGVTYHGRWGVFMRRVMIVVIANGKYVAMRFIRNLPNWKMQPELILDPQNLEKGEPLQSGLDLVEVTSAPYVLQNEVSHAR